MEKIRLYTRDGGYVTTVIVPQFKPSAEVLVWGSRFFRPHPDKKQVYVECFAFMAIETEVEEGL